MGLFDTFWHRILRRPYGLSCADIGTGGQTVVLLHGLAASKDMWLPVISEMPRDKWRIIVPDLLGFGDSPKPGWNDYTAREHARMVLALLKKRGVTDPITIVGHSMGCLVAVHMAAMRPASVKQLVLYEPPLLGDAPDFPVHTKRSARYKTLFEYVASHPQLAHLQSRLLWRVARRISGLYLSPEQWVPFERSLRNTVMDQQAYAQLAAVVIPTDIVYGRLDFIVIRHGVREMLRHNKNITFHLVTDIHGLSDRSARYLVKLLHTNRRSVLR